MIVIELSLFHIFHTAAFKKLVRGCEIQVTKSVTRFIINLA